ncbi:polysaccharide deacetylase family protein [Actinocorallia longicatena]|uniref:NodB homology domain-containing protein n=1 Tax=Actinocorallia longicatena TaxID=111803 RepID=A0ABP6QPF4_9ACTN
MILRLLCSVLLATLLLPAPPAAAADPTIVSLTFDDGLADQYTNGLPILDAHGMKGTFYVISGRLGTSGNLTQAQATTIAAGGHEIGGHTLTHADLPTLNPAQQRVQICDDRVALLGMGFTVKNFAYPFGNADATTEQASDDCGYNSARGVGGLVSPGGCGGCPTAEDIPPVDPEYVATPSSIKTTTTLAQLKNYVTQAENNGGGWVPLVFHHVCASCGDDYAVTPATLTAFLDWLQPRAASGTTVKTVDQVIGGPLQPGVPGTPPPGPAGVQNPSLETATGGVPDCFQLGGWGTSTHAWTRVADAHTGSWAEQVKITAYTDGDRKLVTRQDAGTCAPPVTPGHVYRLGAWYKGTWAAGVKVKMSYYYRSAAGIWTFWGNGLQLAATASYAQNLVTTPPVPAGATAISFGIALPGLGTLITDDFTLVDIT